ncbi:MAG: hypothetical protein JNK06_12235 [Candidatus Accumulibacter phosphatis]|uniref:hypothetical protein n=1 Tax=Candidatus Accumulibacter phosphatis TaxID=327160 RepID=UPI001A635B65|nr:hypothetical protein [Candidatus Accumulibacter phosphatis]
MKDGTTSTRFFIGSPHQPFDKNIRCPGFFRAAPWVANFLHRLLRLGLLALDEHRDIWPIAEKGLFAGTVAAPSQLPEGERAKSFHGSALLSIFPIEKAKGTSKQTVPSG